MGLCQRWPESYVEGTTENVYADLCFYNKRDSLFKLHPAGLKTSFPQLPWVSDIGALKLRTSLRAVLNQRELLYSCLHPLLGGSSHPVLADTGNKELTSWPKSGTWLKGHPKIRVPHGGGWVIWHKRTSLSSLPLLCPAFFSSFLRKCCSQECCLINFLHTILYISICFQKQWSNTTYLKNGHHPSKKKKKKDNQFLYVIWFWYYPLVIFSLCFKYPKVSKTYLF